MNMFNRTGYLFAISIVAMTAFGASSRPNVIVLYYDDGTGGGGNGARWDADNNDLKSAKGKTGGTPCQLFNLKDDVGERNNLLLSPGEHAITKEKQLLKVMNEIRGEDT
ncbi:hypothetical protein [Pontiella sulfatireligans]|uniref:Uncharacterized protein n=1 Tax=Pontiella sulfatireligans TaxID=2750658 RepID=A0A6C2UGN8_9BACT|nr:hypothetical protein [Pontiella sulfatireligans]VGO19350.1 hypothetical protein SCARR_01408 [Pontiella sulfatireligans]